MTAVSPFVDLIEKLTVAELSTALNAPYQTVAAWKQRKRIPVSHWPQLIEVAKRHDIDLTLELLHAWRAATKRGDA